MHTLTARVRSALWLALDTAAAVIEAVMKPNRGRPRC
jgi:hypothetical protein